VKDTIFTYSLIHPEVHFTLQIPPLPSFDKPAVSSIQVPPLPPLPHTTVLL